MECTGHLLASAVAAFASAHVDAATCGRTAEMRAEVRTGRPGLIADFVAYLCGPCDREARTLAGYQRSHPLRPAPTP